jgi:lysine 6-dehydrogenase
MDQERIQASGKPTFAVIGSGMQGTAAAYDLAKFAPGCSILLADLFEAQAIKAASRVNHLLGRSACNPVALDVSQPEELKDFLSNVDVVLSCVPYWMHPQIAKCAIATSTHLCDLGGNTDITLKTLSLDESARQAGVSIVPDCGLAPGLVNSLGLLLIESFDSCDTVKLFCGVLPQHPKPPFNYKLTFNVEGLVTEYDYKALALREGEIVELDTLSELESVEFDELGTMEAFTTSGGTSTAAQSFQGRLRNYEYKTLRFPGHCERMRIFKDFGFWSEEALDVKGVSVRPKDVFCRVFGPQLERFADTDQCLIRAVGIGEKGGRPTQIQIDLHDHQDEATGFTSMERLTGFSLSIIAQEISSGHVAPGCIRYERAMTGAEFVKQLERRGIRPVISESILDARLEE